MITYAVLTVAVPFFAVLAIWCDECAADVGFEPEAQAPIREQERCAKLVEALTAIVQSGQYDGPTASWMKDVAEDALYEWRTKAEPDGGAPKPDPVSVLPQEQTK